MRVLLSTLFVSLLSSTSAAPALVWESTNDEGVGIKHSSDALHASSLIQSTFSSSSGSSLDVFFFLDRGNDGTEMLTDLASKGKLNSVASHYESASTMHHIVNGIETAPQISKLLGEIDEREVMETSIQEFNNKLDDVALPEISIDAPSKSKRAHRRALAVNKANILLVRATSKEASELDAAISKAILSDKVSNVIVAGQRSADEAAAGRKADNAHRRTQMKTSKLSDRRRLDAADDYGYDETEGVYYVNMTPNIFSGILFTFLFIFVVNVGIGCLGDIQGQDVYAKKYPTIGREA